MIRTPKGEPCLRETAVYLFEKGDAVIAGSIASFRMSFA